MSVSSSFEAEAPQNPTTYYNGKYLHVSLELLPSIKSRHEIPSRFEGGSDSGVSDDAISISEEPEEETYGSPSPSSTKRQWRKAIRYISLTLLGLCWLTFTLFLMFCEEHHYDPSLLSIPPGKGFNYKIHKDMDGISLVLKLKGFFEHTTFNQEPSGDIESHHLRKDDKPSVAFVMQELNKKSGVVNTVSDMYNLHIMDSEMVKRSFAVVVEKVIRNITFAKDSNYQLNFVTNIDRPFSMELFLASASASQSLCIIWGLIVLCVIYLNVVFELVHRTFAGVLSCSLAIGILAAIHLRLSLSEIFELIDMNIVMTFFGISIIMEMLAETGLQDYLAALCYELSNGHIWPLLNVVFLASWSLSTIFDDITLILFLAPICLRLCEIMHLNCTPVLGCLIIAMNVGSTLTPASSVTNSLIANHRLIPKDQVGFGTFTLHMLPVTVLTLAQSYIHLRLQFIDSQKIGAKEPIELERLKRLTRLWRKVSERMGAYSLDERAARETVNTRVRSLRKRLKRLGKMPIPPHDFQEKLERLRDDFPVQKTHIMVACLSSLAAVLLFSTFNLLSTSISISIGWMAVISALLALSLCDFKDIEGILSRIDWATMLLLSCLFIFMQVLIKLDVMEAIGLYLENLIASVEENHRLTVAILSITWISAGLTTLMYNAPVVNMMIPIIVTISLNEQLQLPLMPMVWSLALGCCLGGNGSIVGAVVNIACAGVATKHGYKIKYMGYLKIGFFVMVGNIVVASCYLLLAHVVGHWH